MLSGNLARCPNMALRPLVIRSDTGADFYLGIYGTGTAVGPILNIVSEVVERVVQSCRMDH